MLDSLSVTTPATWEVAWEFLRWSFEDLAIGSLYRRAPDFTSCRSSRLQRSALEHPVFSVPGCTARMCRWASLHVLYTKGIYGHILGSCLHYLRWYDPPGKRQKAQPSDKLNVVFRQIQRQYTLQKVERRLANLQLKMFVKDLTSPWSTCLFWKAAWICPGPSIPSSCSASSAWLP